MTLPRWPIITDAHIDAAAEAVASGQLTESRIVGEFEDEFADYAGTRHAIAVCNGTAAVEVALQAAGIRAGDRVAVPAYTFAGSVLGARRLGCDLAWRDVNSSTYVATGTSGQVRGEVLVHLFGQPAPFPLDVPIVVEDCAQAYGARYEHGQPVGRNGVAAAWSLNQAKTVFGGEGGVVTTDDDAIADEARALRSFGGQKHYALRGDGYNWKLDTVSAAIARVSLLLVDEYVATAIANAERLTEALAGVPVAEPFALGRHVYHQYRIGLPPFVDPDRFVAYCDREGVPAARWETVPLTRQPGFFNGAAMPGAEFVATRTVTIGGDHQPAQTWRPSDLDRWADVINRACEERP